MKKITLNEVSSYVEEHIKEFHKSRIDSLKSTELNSLLLKKNPYLFKAKNILTAETLVLSFLDAKLSSSEEEIFGQFLEKLAIFVAGRNLKGVKSKRQGIDLEYETAQGHFLINIKSGLSWGNADQWRALENNFHIAINNIKSKDRNKEVRCFIASCYGKAKTTVKKKIITQVCGQTFWFMISGKPEFYTEMIEPLGHRAKEMDDEFLKEKAKVVNIFTRRFIDEFCYKNGQIDWRKLVKFNSGNLKAPL